MRAGKAWNPMSVRRGVANLEQGCCSPSNLAKCIVSLRRLLGLLNSCLGTLLLAGRHCLSSRFPFVLCWTDMPREAREAVLLSWATSKFGMLRKVRDGACSATNAARLVLSS